jgi:uncharacterized membrane protein YqhA
MTQFLAACRYLLIVPVVGCIILTAGTVLMGIIRIGTAGVKLVSSGDYSAKAAKIMSLAVIEIIDLFLVATVAYITAAGLYKLFISNTQIELPTRLKINSLKDLEDKMSGFVMEHIRPGRVAPVGTCREPERDPLAIGGPLRHQPHSHGRSRLCAR